MMQLNLRFNRVFCQVTYPARNGPKVFIKVSPNPTRAWPEREPDP